MAALLTPDGRNAIIFLSIWTAIATVVVLLRLARKRSRGVFGADDWLLILALILLYEQNAWGYIFAIVGGEGKRISRLTEHELQWFFKVYYFCELGYSVQVTVTRLSVLISFKRLLWHIQWCYYAIQFLATVCLLWFLGSFLSFVFQCRPVQKAYLPNLPGSCFDIEKWILATSTSNMIIDWSILLLPVHPLRRVRSRLDRVNNALVCASFGLGIIACVASSARAALAYKVTHDVYTMPTIVATMSTHAEPMIGLISASLPFLTLGHYFNKVYLVIRRLFGRESEGTRLDEDEENLRLSVVEILGSQGPSWTITPATPLESLPEPNYNAQETST